MSEFRTWNEAILHNRDLPCGDIINIEQKKTVYRVREQGDLVDPNIGRIFSDFFDFVLEQQYIRRTTQSIPKDWILYCSKEFSNDTYRYPRWTFPFCYFDEKYAPCFSGTIGLDVGCNVYPLSMKTFLDSFVDRHCGGYLSEPERFVPHHRYYRGLGCNIRGIDIHPVSENFLGEERGDLRMLETPDSLIDFFTVAMIFGPGNPASTFLDTALCLAELRRTLRRNGLIYIAEFVVKPSVVSCALHSGFRVFANNSYQTGIPIGLHLIQKETEIKASCFRPILEYLTPFELSLSKYSFHLISNRELLRKDVQPPMIETLSCREPS